jgi:hypothetical protein
MTEAQVTESGDESSEDQFMPTPFDATTLPGELAHEPSLKNFDSVDKLANSYVHAVRKMGAPPESFLKIPQEGESWDQIHRALGRPEAPEDYTFDEFNNDEDEGLDYFKGWSHKQGFTQDQAQNILGELNDIVVQGKEQQMQERQIVYDQGMESLQREWPGDAFDENMDLARRAFSQLATKESVALLEDSGLSDHPEVVKIFHKMGKMMGEANLVMGQSAGVGDLTPSSAQEKINELYNQKDFLDQYRDNQNPSHKEATKRMDRLFKIAYPNQ